MAAKAKTEVVEETKGVTTKKLKCSCKSTFQDKTYGEGMRLHARAGSKSTTIWRCTVCGNEK
jgi:hypothetical protein